MRGHSGRSSSALEGGEVLNGLDLFSGIGGLTIALSEWVRPVAYCELEPYAAGVLFNRMADGDLPCAPIFPDIRRLSASLLPSIDIIYGGFPCQDVSTAGLREGLDGKRTGLFREAIRLVRECNPQFVFLENVPGIRRYVPEIRGELEALGYDCRDGFLSAAEVGANHIRNRWWLLAHANNNRCDEPYKSEPEREQECKDSTNTLDDGAQKPLAEVVYAGSERLSRSMRKARQVSTGLNGSGWWDSEPDVGRVVNGLPMRVDRIKGLGNSVVPQCAKEAFKILMGLT
jgi:DNA (cytosine-5)-methyltransferase 1